MNQKEKLKELEEKIGYSFRDFGLLEMAMRHSSYANEHHMERLVCNERLEFLGDAVLEVVSSEFLYQKFPRLPEGELTKKRASLVCEPALAFCARELELGSYLLLGKGEEATGGRSRDSITSDAMEATIGAVFLDGGFEPARQFVLRFVLNDIEHKQLFYDSKTILQEIIQSETDEEIVYEILKEEGPDHDKNFWAQIRVGNKVLGTGKGRTKKAAEQAAAYDAILGRKKSAGEVCISNQLKCRDLSPLPIKQCCSSMTESRVWWDRTAAERVMSQMLSGGFLESRVPNSFVAAICRMLFFPVPRRENRWDMLPLP